MATSKHDDRGVQWSAMVNHVVETHETGRVTLESYKLLMGMDALFRGYVCKEVA